MDRVLVPRAAWEPEVALLEMVLIVLAIQGATSWTEKKPPKTRQLIVVQYAERTLPSNISVGLSKRNSTDDSATPLMPLI